MEPSRGDEAEGSLTTISGKGTNCKISPSYSSRGFFTVAIDLQFVAKINKRQRMCAALIQRCCHLRRPRQDRFSSFPSSPRESLRQ